MRFAIVGSGAVGGYYGARLAQAGHDVTFLARGAHLQAIRERGLWIWSPLGDAVIHAKADDSPAAIGPVDVVVFAVKAYNNAGILPTLSPLFGRDTTILTLQNGVDSAEEIAAVVGEAPVIAGSEYIATVLRAPGLIEQTGTHRRIVYGEWFGDRAAISDRVNRLHAAFTESDIQSDPRADVRPGVWEKFVFLAPIAAVASAARSATGTLQEDAYLRETFMGAMREAEQVARAEGIDVDAGILEKGQRYFERLPAAMRPSMLNDLSIGKRMELEALAGTIVRRGAARGVATPIVSTLYAVLRPFAAGELRERTS